MFSAQKSRLNMKQPKQKNNTFVSVFLKLFPAFAFISALRCEDIGSIRARALEPTTNIIKI
jgi:hypothetical protein